MIKKYYVQRNTPVDLNRVNAQINDWQQNTVPTIKKMYDYYNGSHAIYQQTNRTDWREDVRVASNFCSQITAVKSGYFAGKPYNLNVSDEDFGSYVADIDADNDYQAKFTDHATTVSIAGISYELLYVWRNTVRYIPISPLEMFAVYYAEVEPDIAYAVRIYDVIDDISQDTVTYVDIYTPTDIIHCIRRDDRLEVYRDNTRHYFGETPVVVYEHPQGASDYTQIIPLQDLYNSLMSNEVTDVQLMHDAMMVMRDVDFGDPPQIMDAEGNYHDDPHYDYAVIMQLLRDRIIRLDSAEETTGTIEWLQKPHDTARVMTILDRIKADVQNITSVPDYTSDTFSGNLSGQALRIKLQNFENAVAPLEATFRRALSRRYYLISLYANLKGQAYKYDYKSIKISFTRNLPENDNEKIDNALKLNVDNAKLLSTRTIMSLLPMIDNVDDEIEQIERESKQDMASPAMRKLLTSYLPDAADVDENIEEDIEVQP